LFPNNRTSPVETQTAAEYVIHVVFEYYKDETSEISLKH